MPQPYSFHYVHRLHTIKTAKKSIPVFCNKYSCSTTCFLLFWFIVPVFHQLQHLLCWWFISTYSICWVKIIHHCHKWESVSDWDITRWFPRGINGWMVFLGRVLICWCADHHSMPGFPSQQHSIQHIKNLVGKWSAANSDVKAKFYGYVHPRFYFS